MIEQIKVYSITPYSAAGGIWYNMTPDVVYITDLNLLFSHDYLKLETNAGIQEFISKCLFSFNFLEVKNLSEVVLDESEVLVDVGFSHPETP